MARTPRIRITKARQMQGLTRADVASRLGVSEATVARWEKGQTAIHDDHKLALSEMFAVSVPFLMGWANGNNAEEDEAA